MKFQKIGLILFIIGILLIITFFIVPKDSTEKLVLSLDKDNITLNVNDNIAVKEIFSKDNYVITWYSDDPNIASVSEGIIKAIAPGTTVITAKVDNIEAKCNVTVNEITASKDNIMEMHFIANGYYDDSILIRDNYTVIYIDGGRTEAAKKDISYLKDLGITKIDYMIGSHVEYDHVAAQADILDNFEVDKIVYPVDLNTCHKKCYCANDIDNSIILKGLQKHEKEAIHQKIPSRDNVGIFNFYYLAPFNYVCNNNNNSFVFIMTYGNNSFMFTGDADSALRNPNKLINNAKELGLENINVDVFKHPHHGNETLSNSLFPAINTKYFIVPNYGFSRFPNPTNLANIKKRGIKVYRQSESKTGNILITSDGDNIEFIMDVVAKDYAR